MEQRSKRFKEGLLNTIDWLIYPAIVTLAVAKSPNELKCLVSLAYALTPLAPFGVRERVIKSLTKKR